MTPGESHNEWCQYYCSNLYVFKLYWKSHAKAHFQTPLYRFATRYSGDETIKYKIREYYAHLVNGVSDSTLISGLGDMRGSRQGGGTWGRDPWKITKLQIPNLQNQHSM